LPSSAVYVSAAGWASVIEYVIGFRQFLNLGVSHVCAARRFEPKEASMPNRIPNTQTGSLRDHERGTNDTLVNVGLFGDAFDMFDSSRGGNDILIGGPGGFEQLIGDAFAMFDSARGGNDTLISKASEGGVLWGDAREMHDSTRGGNDTLIGGDSPGTWLLYGDALEMYFDSRGGNDTVIGGGAPQTSLFGDSGSMFHSARGGNDRLIAGDSDVSLLRGDAGIMLDDSRGGNDTLIGSDGSVSYLVGDGFQMQDNARGGKDTLVSGTGTDHMWGDGQVINGVAASPTEPTGSVRTAADTFVFAPANGNDDINDFRQGDHDRIDVRAWGFQSLADMTIIDAGTDTRIEFDATNSVTLVGFGDPGALQESDFIFA
jgi:serralysin